MKTQREMTIDEKGKLIRNIISSLRFQAANEKKPFDGGDTFFALCFKSDKELVKISKLCGM